MLAYGDRAYELVMGGHDKTCSDFDRPGVPGDWAVDTESRGPPRCARISVWRKVFLSEQHLGDVEVPLDGLDDRRGLDEWCALRGDRGSSW